MFFLIIYSFVLTLFIHASFMSSFLVYFPSFTITSFMLVPFFHIFFSISFLVCFPSFSLISLYFFSGVRHVLPPIVAMAMWPEAREVPRQVETAMGCQKGASDKNQSEDNTKSHQSALATAKIASRLHAEVAGVMAHLADLENET